MALPRVPNDVSRDVFAALVLVALGQVELGSGDGAPWWRYGVAVLATLPVAISRRRPIIALGLVVAALSVLTIQQSSSFTVAQLLAMMVVSYALAARVARVRAGVGLGVLMAAAFANSAAAPDSEPGDYVFAVILLGVPWAAGLGVRLWRERADQLAGLAAELEASRAEHARLQVAAERGRIARDLHDSVAQTLNAVVLQAEAASEALGRDEDVVRRALRGIRDAARESLSETRLLLGMLRSDPELDASPGLAGLDRLIERSRADGSEIEVRVSGAADRLSPAVGAAAYRIVQESLTNARRHAPGRPVSVTIECGPDLVLEVRNDCAGPASAAGLAGYGLLGMRERAQLLGGVLDAGLVGNTFVVRACLPTGAAS